MLKGSIDLIDHHRLRGWAQEDAAPEKGVPLVICVNDREVGRLTAEIFREELRDAGVGNGQHGFEFKFDAALSPYVKHVINVRSEDGSDVPGSPATLTALPPPQAPGNLDRANRHTIAGWCQDSQR